MTRMCAYLVIIYEIADDTLDVNQGYISPLFYSLIDERTDIVLYILRTIKCHTNCHHQHLNYFKTYFYK